jgi:hypothetical protein
MRTPHAKDPNGKHIAPQIPGHRGRGRYGRRGRTHFTGFSDRRLRAGSSAWRTARDLALVNGRIHTMDARNSIATMVTIRNGRFATVGGAARPPSDTQVIDLRGRTVVPGLIEGHIHSVSLANRPGYHTILENTTSIREIRKRWPRVEKCARGAMDHVDGRLASEPVGRAPSSDAEGAGRRRPPTGRCSVRALHWTVRDQYLGKKFFDAVDAAPPVHPDIKRSTSRIPE